MSTVTRLTLDQKAELEIVARELRAKIHGPSLDVRERSSAGCPKCKMPVSFKPDGVWWECWPCKHKFTDVDMYVIKRLVCREIGSETGGADISAFDELELKRRILDLSTFVTPWALYGSEPTLYANIVHSYGSLERAFAAVGIQYANPAVENWQTSIIEYLGVLPDAQIASIIGKTRQAVTDYRVRCGVASAAENWSDMDVTQEAIAELKAQAKEQLAGFVEEYHSTNFRSVRRMAYEVIRQNGELTSPQLLELLVTQHGIKLSDRTIRKYRQHVRLESQLVGVQA